MRLKVSYKCKLTDNNDKIKSEDKIIGNNNKMKLNEIKG